MSTQQRRRRRRQAEAGAMAHMRYHCELRTDDACPYWLTPGTEHWVSGCGLTIALVACQACAAAWGKP